MESTFTTWAWAGEMSKQLEGAEKVFFGELRRQAGGAGDAATKSLKPLQRSYGAREVAQVLRDEGVSPELSEQLGALWHRNLEEASLAGEEAARRVHYDFLDERNIEQWTKVRAWAPFHFWATRNLPYYLQTMAHNPWMLRLWHDYHSLSDREREESGLTARFADTIPWLRGGDPLTTLLFGPGRVYFNPLVVMSIEDQLKPIGEDRDLSALGKLANVAGKVGLSPAPWVSIPLTIVGAYGEVEPGNVLRLTGLVNSALSSDLIAGTPIDIEGPIKGTARAAQKRPAPTSEATLGGMPFGGSEATDYAIAKKLAELSIERTGRPNHPDYVAAMANPASPLYRQAQALVRGDYARQQALGFVSPVPTRNLPPTEEAIRQRTADLRSLYGDQNGQLPPQLTRALAQTGDLATGYWRAQSDPRVARINAGLAQPRGSYSPGVFGELARLREQAQHPETQRYLAWLRSLPPGVADRSPADFIQLHPSGML
jgi:hypothetical protein